MFFVNNKNAWYRLTKKYNWIKILLKNEAMPWCQYSRCKFDAFSSETMNRLYVSEKDDIKLARINF